MTQNIEHPRAGGFDVSTDQAKAIEEIISEKFFSPRYDYQLGTS
ncbi:DUF7683 domain-containing protein [Salinivibrio socompensis]